MKFLNCQKIQHKVLRALYRLAPFDLKGDLQNRELISKPGLISCLIVSNRPAQLEGLLSDLKAQDISKDSFETIIISNEQVHLISDLRNASILRSKGEFLLFLDDDTRIYQKDFLSKALVIFKSTDCDLLIPQANPLFGIIRGRYEFLDRFSMANRCIFYRKSVIQELGGFMKGLAGYEDIELSIRLMIKDPRILQEKGLNYYHPPLYFDSLRKPLAIGQSIFNMQRQYSLPVWLLAYFNGLRFLPLGLIPGDRFRQWFKISLGILLYPFTGKSYYY